MRQCTLAARARLSRRAFSFIALLLLIFNDDPALALPAHNHSVAGTDPVTVKGQVSDAAGSPLLNATVQVKGANITVATDDNGGDKITSRMWWDTL